MEAALQAASRIPALLAARIAAFIASWRERMQLRDAHDALSALDTRTLRDLGLHRSEIGSVVEEWSGRAERERRIRFIRYY